MSLHIISGMISRAAVVYSCQCGPERLFPKLEAWRSSFGCVLGGFQRLCAASEGLEKPECSTLHAYASVSGGF